MLDHGTGFLCLIRCSWVVFATACGGPGVVLVEEVPTDPSPQQPFDEEGTVEEVVVEDAPAVEPAVEQRVEPPADTPVAANGVPACRVLRPTAGNAVDVRAVPARRSRLRRIGPRAGSVGFPRTCVT